MGKVKIKRVTRKHKKATTAEKVLAGIGVGSTFMGGAGSVNTKQQVNPIVRTRTDTQGSATSKIKDVLESIFGIHQAKADSLDDAVASAKNSLDNANKALNNFDDWVNKATADVNGTGDPAAAQYYQDNPDKASERLDQIQAEVDKTRPGLQSAVDQASANYDNAVNAQTAGHQGGSGGSGGGVGGGGGNRGGSGGGNGGTTSGPQAGDPGTVQGRSAHYVLQNGILMLVEDAGHTVLNPNGFYYTSDGNNGWTLNDGQHKTENGHTFHSQGGNWIDDGPIVSGPQPGDPGTVQGRSAHYKMINGVLVLAEDAGHRVTNPNGFDYISDGSNGWTLADGQNKTENGHTFHSQGGNWIDDGPIVSGPQAGDPGTVNGRTAHYKVVNGTLSLVEDAGHSVLNGNGFYYTSDGNNGWTLNDGQHKTENGHAFHSQSGSWVDDGPVSATGHQAGEYGYIEGRSARYLNVNGQIVLVEDADHSVLNGNGLYYTSDGNNGWTLNDGQKDPVNHPGQITQGGAWVTDPASNPVTPPKSPQFGDYGTIEGRSARYQNVNGIPTLVEDAGHSVLNGNGLYYTSDGHNGWTLNDGQKDPVNHPGMISQGGSWVTDPSSNPITPPATHTFGEYGTIEGRSARYQNVNGIPTLVEDAGHSVLNGNGLYYTSDGNNGWTLNDGQKDPVNHPGMISQGGAWVTDPASNPITPPTTHNFGDYGTIEGRSARYQNVNGVPTLVEDAGHSVLNGNGLYYTSDGNNGWTLNDGQKDPVNHPGMISQGGSWITDPSSNPVTPPTTHTFGDYGTIEGRSARYQNVNGIPTLVEDAGHSVLNGNGLYYTSDGHNGWTLNDGQKDSINHPGQISQGGAWVTDPASSPVTPPVTHNFGDYGTIEGRSARYQNVNGIPTLVEDAGHSVLNGNGLYYTSDGNNGWTLNDGQKDPVNHPGQVTSGGGWITDATGANPTTPPATHTFGDYGTIEGRSARYQNVNGVPTLLEDPGHDVVNPNGFHYLSDGNNGWVLVDGQKDPVGHPGQITKGGEWVKNDGTTPVTNDPNAPVKTYADLAGTFATTSWSNLTDAQKQVFTDYFAGGKNQSDIPGTFAANSAFSYALGWGTSTADQTFNGITYEVKNGQWQVKTTSTTDPNSGTKTPATHTAQDFMDQGGNLPYADFIKLSAADQQKVLDYFSNQPAHIAPAFSSTSLAAYGLGLGGDPASSAVKSAAAALGLVFDGTNYVKAGTSTNPVTPPVTPTAFNYSSYQVTSAKQTTVGQVPSLTIEMTDSNGVKQSFVVSLNADGTLVSGQVIKDSFGKTLSLSDIQGMVGQVAPVLPALTPATQAANDAAKKTLASGQYYFVNMKGEVVSTGQPASVDQLKAANIQYYGQDYANQDSVKYTGQKAPFPSNLPNTAAWQGFINNPSSFPTPLVLPDGSHDWKTLYPNASAAQIAQMEFDYNYFNNPNRPADWSIDNLGWDPYLAMQQRTQLGISMPTAYNSATNTPGNPGGTNKFYIWTDAQGFTHVAPVAVTGSDGKLASPTDPSGNTVTAHLGVLYNGVEIKPGDPHWQKDGAGITYGLINDKTGQIVNWDDPQTGMTATTFKQIAASYLFGTTNPNSTYVPPVAPKTVAPAVDPAIGKSFTYKVNDTLTITATSANDFAQQMQQYQNQPDIYSKLQQYYSSTVIPTNNARNAMIDAGQTTVQDYVSAFNQKYPGSDVQPSAAEKAQYKAVTGNDWTATNYNFSYYEGAGVTLPSGDFFPNSPYGYATYDTATQIAAMVGNGATVYAAHGYGYSSPQYLIVQNGSIIGSAGNIAQMVQQQGPSAIQKFITAAGTVKTTALPNWLTPATGDFTKDLAPPTGATPDAYVGVPVKTDPATTNTPTNVIDVTKTYPAGYNGTQAPATNSGTPVSPLPAGFVVPVGGFAPGTVLPNNLVVGPNATLLDKTGKVVGVVPVAGTVVGSPVQTPVTQPPGQGATPVQTTGGVVTPVNTIAPVIQSLSVTLAGKVNTVTVIGSNFATTSANNQLKIMKNGDVVASVSASSASANSTTFALPASLAAGQYTVQVINLTGYLATSNSLSLTILSTVSPTVAAPVVQNSIKIAASTDSTIVVPPTVNQVTPTPVVVVSSDPTVVKVSQVNNQISIRGLTEGTATVVVHPANLSVADTTKDQTITVTVGPAAVVSPTTASVTGVANSGSVNPQVTTSVSGVSANPALAADDAEVENADVSGSDASNATDSAAVVDPAAINETTDIANSDTVTDSGFATATTAPAQTYTPASTYTPPADTGAEVEAVDVADLSSGSNQTIDPGAEVEASDTVTDGSGTGSASDTGAEVEVADTQDLSSQAGTVTDTGAEVEVTDVADPSQTVTDAGATANAATVIASTSDATITALQQQINDLQTRLTAANAQLGSSSGNQYYATQLGSMQSEISRLNGIIDNLKNNIPARSSAGQSFVGLQYQEPAPQVTVQNTQTTQSGTTYTVKKGDTLWGISKQYYGDGRLWRKILLANTNQIKNPKTLRIGSVITIPTINN